MNKEQLINELWKRHNDCLVSSDTDTYPDRRFYEGMAEAYARVINLLYQEPKPEPVSYKIIDNTFHPGAGEELDRAAEAAASAPEKPLWFSFNDTKVIIHLGDTGKTLADRWWQSRNK